MLMVTGTLFSDPARAVSSTFSSPLKNGVEDVERVWLLSLATYAKKATLELII